MPILSGMQQTARPTERLRELEAKANCARVVAQLPPRAELGTLFRLAGDQTGALYMGNGNGPLTKLVPGPL